MNKHVIHPSGLLAQYAAERERQLSAEDRLTLVDLVQSLELSVDSRDFAAFRTLVSPDWHYRAAFGTYASPDAFITDVERQRELFDGIRHQHLNVVARSRGENRAVVLSYIIVMQVSGPDGTVRDGMPRIIGHGVSRDEAERRDGVWKLTSRTIDQTAALPALVTDESLRQRFGEVALDEPEER